MSQDLNIISLFASDIQCCTINMFRCLAEDLSTPLNLLQMIYNSCTVNIPITRPEHTKLAANDVQSCTINISASNIRKDLNDHKKCCTWMNIPSTRMVYTIMCVQWISLLHMVQRQVSVSRALSSTMYSNTPATRTTTSPKSRAQKRLLPNFGPTVFCCCLNRIFVQRIKMHSWNSYQRKLPFPCER